MPGSILVARLLGIDIRIHVSWFIIFGLILILLADRLLPSMRPAWSQEKTLVVAAIAALLFFGSILLHELSHAIVARRFHMPVSSITLFLLGGVANLAKEPPSAKAEFLMAIVGPLTSLAIGGVGLLVADLAMERMATLPALDPVEVVATYLGLINIALAVFNMIPGFPLDGGRVLRSIIWGIRGDRSIATRIAGRGGQLVAGLLVFYGLYRAMSFGDTFNAIWAGLIAYFLYTAASSAIEQDRVATVVGGTRVGSLMTTDFRSTGPGVPIASVIRELFLPWNLRAVPVVQDDRLLGIVTIDDLRRVDQAEWMLTPVERVMRRGDDVPTLSPDDRLLTALERFGPSDLPVLPVVQRASLVGLLDREALVSYVRMREMLGLGGR